jgi:hypothetical protein
VIPDSVEEIQSYSFSECTLLRTIEFGEDSHLKMIRDCAFDKTSIERVAFPRSLEHINEWAFCRCRFLKQISFHSDSALTTIGEGAFAEMSLESIDFPDSLVNVLFQKKAKRSKLNTLRPKR